MYYEDNMRMFLLLIVDSVVTSYGVAAPEDRVLTFGKPEYVL